MFQMLKMKKSCKDKDPTKVKIKIKKTPTCYYIKRGRTIEITKFIVTFDSKIGPRVQHSKANLQLIESIYRKELDRRNWWVAHLQGSDRKAFTSSSTTLVASPLQAQEEGKVADWQNKAYQDWSRIHTFLRCVEQLEQQGRPLRWNWVHGMRSSALHPYFQSCQPSPALDKFVKRPSNSDYAAEMFDFPDQKRELQLPPGFGYTLLEVQDFSEARREGVPMDEHPLYGISDNLLFADYVRNTTIYDDLYDQWSRLRPSWYENVDSTSHSHYVPVPTLSVTPRKSNRTGTSADGQSHGWLRWHDSLVRSLSTLLSSF